MTSDLSTDVTSLLNSISELKREAAKVIAGMQFGGDRRKRRDLTRRMEACRRRARALSREASVLLPHLQDETERAELQKQLSFLAQLSVLGARDRSTTA